MQHTAKLRLRVEPMPTAAGVVVSTLPDHGLPGDMLTVVLEELENAGQGGGVLGFPLMRVKATLLVGEMHETESTDIAFRMAAAAGVRRRACAKPARCCSSRS